MCVYIIAASRNVGNFKNNFFFFCKLITKYVALRYRVCYYAAVGHLANSPLDIDFQPPNVQTWHSTPPGSLRSCKGHRLLLLCTLHAFQGFGILHSVRIRFNGRIHRPSVRSRSYLFNYVVLGWKFSSPKIAWTGFNDM